MKIAFYHKAIWICTSLILSACTNTPPQEHVEKKTEQLVQKKEETHAEPEIHEPILGIDVSHFQGRIDWVDIKTDKISFAYAKATQGEYYKDPDFKTNWTQAKKAKLHTGAYHFYVAGDDPIKQAENFISTVQEINKGEMPPVLDLEQGGMKTGIHTATYQKNVMLWLNKVEKELGIQPIIYTNYPFGNSYLNSPEFNKYDLWIAEYEVKQPRVPTTWANKGWLIWQRAEKGKVSGTNGNVDHDLFKKNTADFLDILKK